MMSILGISHVPLYDSQAPDPALEAIYGVGNTPSYRGRAYIVFPLYDITQWKAIPQYAFEVVTGGSSAPAVASMAIARLGTNNYWITSPDGINWPGPFEFDSVLDGRGLSLTATDESYVTIGVNNAPAYMVASSDEFLVSSGASSGGTSSNGLGRGWFSESEQIIKLPKKGFPYLLWKLEKRRQGSYLYFYCAYLPCFCCLSCQV